MEQNGRWGGKQVGKANASCVERNRYQKRPSCPGLPCAVVQAGHHTGIPRLEWRQAMGMMRGADHLPCSAGEVGLDLPRERVIFYFPQVYL